MRRHLSYLWYVLRHKYFVFMAGLSLRVSLWQLLIHDWHKFTPGEWFAYARCFYKPNGEHQYQPDEAFTRAWNAHQKRGKHHWQYWLITWDHGGTDAIEMPDRYRREMLADWIGAGRALGKPDTLEWYTKNRHKMNLHDKTRRWFDVQLGYREDYAPIDVIRYMTELARIGHTPEELEKFAKAAFCTDGNAG
jgi:hypothetical protein